MLDLQFPFAALRMEEVFYEKLELRKEHRMNNLEYLGQAMTEAGNEFNPGTAYGTHPSTSNWINYVVEILQF